MKLRAVELGTTPITNLQVRRDLAAARLPPVQPFHAMAYPFSADLALAISAKYAEYCAVQAARLSLPPFPHPPAKPLAPGERLRIGYVSSDFGNHPLSHLMGSVFGGHDRSRVSTLAPRMATKDKTQHATQNAHAGLDDYLTLMSARLLSWRGGCESGTHPIFLATSEAP